MNYVPFVVSLFILELILIFLLVHIIIKLMHKVSLTPLYNMSKNSEKIGMLKKILVEIVKPNNMAKEFPVDYKKINIFFFPLVILFFEMLFSGFFGDLIFFYKPSTNFFVNVLKWLFKYVIRIVIIFVTVAVIGNTFYRFNKLRKEEL